MPQDDSELGPFTDGTPTRDGDPTASAVDALARLRGVVDNGELIDTIPAELRLAGFRRVLFSPDFRLAPTSSGHLVVPVLAWRRPVGHLHTEGGPAPAEGGPSLLRLLAEGIGAIFERNALAERLHTMTASAREHAREISLLSEAVGHPAFDAAAATESRW